METILLNGTWELSGKPQLSNGDDKININATVPGCVQLDLSGAGYLPKDLFYGKNILETEKYEDWEWTYTKTFTSPKNRKNLWLVFEGVDCIAEYFLNGKKFGESKNMFIPHEFNITDYIVDGDNVLSVHLKSVTIESHNYNYNTISAIASWRNIVETSVRQAPHCYGWDIMPRAVNTGLWRDVKLEIRDEVYFKQLHFSTEIPNATALIYELECDYNDLDNLVIEIEGSLGDSSFFAKQKVFRKKMGCIRFPINNPKLWWPYGYGEANVYDATVRILRDGAVIHEETASFGLKSVVLDRTDTTDGKSGKFRFLINGVEIMCKGSNWVPLDAFHCRDKDRYDEALALVKDIGCNILRCWGGNVYEDHKFFDFCDRNGIMVWQDFSMACNFYPQDKEFCDTLYKEATAIIRRLRNHPSLILWAGDNEIDYMMSKAVHSVAPSSNVLTRQVLPEAVVHNSLGIPYLPSSPYISDTIHKSRNFESCPEEHSWGPRDYFKSDFYRNSKAHFISETGYHGCPSPESIKKFISPDKVWPCDNNDEWILHSSDQTCNAYRVRLMQKQIAQLFGNVPDSLEEFAEASQISQAEAKKYFIERMRIGRPYKTGIIWWNLLDGWPQMSDAVVDYYFNKKTAYRYIKRSQAPFTIVAGEPANWQVTFYACNDTLTGKSGHYSIIDGETDKVLAEGDFKAAINATTRLCSIPVYHSDHKFFIIKWTTEDGEGFNHFLCGYPPFSVEHYKEIMSKYNI